jgi:hypothetical protein
MIHPYVVTSNGLIGSFGIKHLLNKFGVLKMNKYEIMKNFLGMVKPLTKNIFN